MGFFKVSLPQRYNKFTIHKTPQQEILMLQHHNASTAIRQSKKKPRMETFIRTIRGYFARGYSPQKIYILLLVVCLHYRDKVKHLVRVTPLVVVPRNNLHKGIGQSDTGSSIED